MVQVSATQAVVCYPERSKRGYCLILNINHSSSAADCPQSDTQELFCLSLLHSLYELWGGVPLPPYEISSNPPWKHFVRIFRISGKETWALLTYTSSAMSAWLASRAAKWERCSSERRGWTDDALQLRDARLPVWCFLTDVSRTPLLGWCSLSLSSII